jgi:hypothetical protein
MIYRNPGVHCFQGVAMGNTVLSMAKDKQGAKKSPPSRDKLKYVGIPREYWDIFAAMTQDGEKYEGRSIAFLVKVACRKMLQEEGKVDEKGKPKAG